MLPVGQTGIGPYVNSSSCATDRVSVQLLRMLEDGDQNLSRIARRGDIVRDSELVVQADIPTIHAKPMLDDPTCYASSSDDDDHGPMKRNTSVPGENQ